MKIGNGLKIMQKVLLGMSVINRPKTTEKCIQYILKSNYRDRLTLVAVDNNSNDETKEVLKKYEKDLDLIITNDFNVGVCFSTNQYLTLREPGQYCMKVDVDAWIITPDWIDIMVHVLENGFLIKELGLAQHSIGYVLGRRPSFWLTPTRREYYKSHRVICTQIGKHYVEIVCADGIMWPWVMFHPEILNTIGYMNEAVNTDDIDFAPRAAATKQLGCYIPDVVILQSAHELGHPEWEEQQHLQYAAYRKCWEQYIEGYWRSNYYERYQNFETVYCGSRFLLGSITDPEYQKMSDKNWEFMKNYKGEENERMGGRGNKE